MKDLLSRIDFFSRLDDKILDELAGACVMRQFSRNETIEQQGGMGRGLYLIARGRVTVDREQAGVRMQVAELGPQQFFGEMSLLDYKTLSATVTSIEGSECALLTRESFVRVMNLYPEISIRITHALADRLREATEKVAAKSAPANGVASVPLAPNTRKALILDKLLETFRSLYTIKALSRFSVAVLGCPVEGTAANTVYQIRVGDVKALFFPAGEPVDMRIAALELGSFTLDVFTPPRAYRFGPLAVDPSDRVRLVISGDVKLHYGETVISSPIASQYLADIRPASL